MDEETKKKIWETFKDVFIEEGITSPSKLNFMMELPSEEQYEKGAGFLEKLGNVGKYMVYIMRGTYKFATVVVVLFAFGGIVHKVPTRYPRKFEFVSKVGKAFSKFEKEGYGPSVVKDEKQPTLVIFNQKWEIDQALYNKDTEILNTSGHIPDGSYVVSTSAINHVQPQIYDFTDTSAAKSDLTT